MWRLGHCGPRVASDGRPGPLLRRPGVVVSRESWRFPRREEPRWSRLALGRRARASALRPLGCASLSGWKFSMPPRATLRAVRSGSGPRLSAWTLRDVEMRGLRPHRSRPSECEKRLRTASKGRGYSRPARVSLRGAFPRLRERARMHPDPGKRRGRSRGLFGSRNGRYGLATYSIGISKRAMMPGSPPLASSLGSGSRVATHAYPWSG